MSWEEEFEPGPPGNPMDFFWLMVFVLGGVGIVYLVTKATHFLFGA